MGIVKAAMNAVGGALSDAYLEAYRPGPMHQRTAVVPGIFADAGQGRNTNTKRMNNVISNGSMIQVASGQLMCLVDGGRVVDYTTVPGYYQVQNSSSPSLMNGEFGASLKDGWDRIRFGGNNYHEQRVIYINLRPMEGIKFGTKMPVPYYDEFYKIDVNVRAFGTFSLQIVEPWKFFNTVIPPECITDGIRLDVDDFLDDTFMSEYLGALGEALSNISTLGLPLSRIPTKTTELSKYMQDALDPVWKQDRGIIVKNVGISSISYDDDTKELLKERNKVAIYNDPSMRETFVQTSIARGIEKAGSNSNGAMAGFMGVGMGMNAAGGFMGSASQTNMQQMQMQQQQQMQQQPMQQMQQPMQQAPQAAPAADSWTCACGTSNTGKFCANCGKPKPAPQDNGAWTCPDCGTSNGGKFCANCGKPKPSAPKKIKCDKCGFEPDMTKAIPKFCPNCGDPINEADFQ
jgi:membrane protease subunit (stomatin/prohibitin family)